MPRKPVVKSKDDLAAQDVMQLNAQIDSLKIQLKAAEKALKKPVETIVKRSPDDVRVISDLNNQIEAKDDEIASLRKQRDSAAEALNIATANLTHLKSVIAPFISCARGVTVTAPADWDALKDLDL